MRDSAGSGQETAASHAVPPGSWLARSLPAACMFAIIALGFAHSCALRAPWFGKLGFGHQHWLTGGTLLFSRNWYHEGANRLRWLMLETPASPEFRTLADRIPYGSYPGGHVVPIYLAALASGSEPSPALIMGYNLANHFVTVVIVAILVWRLYLSQGIGPWLAAAAGSLSATIALFNPAAMYFQHSVYFSDQAVIVPFVAFVTLEVLGRNSRALRCLQYAVMVYGIATDWLFVFVMAVTVFKRFATGEMGATAAQRVKNLCLFCAGPALVLMLYVWQLASVGALQALIDKGLARSGFGSTGESQLQQVGGFFQRFWRTYFPGGFGGAFSVPLLWSCACICGAALLLAAWHTQVRRCNLGPRLQPPLTAITLMLLPCLMQVHWFRNHSAHHSFSMLKFSPVMAAVPFFLVPLLIQGAIKEAGGQRLFGRLIVGTGFVLAAVYACRLYSISTAVFFSPVDPTPAWLASTIRSAARSTDVAFSPELEWTMEAGYPQMRALAMKYVHRVNTPGDVERKVEGIEGDYAVLMIFLKPPGPEWAALLSGSESVISLARPLYLQAFRVAPSHLRAVVASGTGSGAVKLGGNTQPAR